jgi:hypothetical protein
MLGKSGYECRARIIQAAPHLSLVDRGFGLFTAFETTQEAPSRVPGQGEIGGFVQNDAPE